MTKLSFLDIFIFSTYLLSLFGIGWWAGRKRKETASDFFLSHQALPWYVISFSFIAATISSQQLIGSVGFAYKYGMAVANWEWLNSIAILVMVFVFIPIYIRKKIITMPEFLEKRYDGRVRTLFAVITLLSYIFINMAGIIYSGAFAIHKIFGLDLYLSICLLTLTAGAFAIYGGMESIAWANVLQAVLLLAGGFIVFALGWAKLPNGLSDMIGTGDRAHLILPANHPDIPWTGLVVLAVSTNIWFFCTNQSINQSALGAKNRWHAQMGVLMVGFLCLFVALADVFPGLIAYALNPNLASADEAYLYVVNELVPNGWKGIIFAALCGGTLSAIEALVNASSAIFVFDVYKRAIQPKATEIQLIRVGRVAGIAVLCIGALWSPVVQKFDQIFAYFQECWAFIAIPVTIIFLAGIFSPRVSAQSAFFTLCLSFPMLLLPYALKALAVTMNVYNVAGFVIIFTLLFLMMLNLIFPKKQDTLSSEFVTNTNDFAIDVVNDKSLIFWSLIMAVCCILLYWWLW